MSDKTTEHVEPRERHIRALAFLMTKKGTPSGACEEFLQNREYGLALAVLAEDVNHDS